MIRSLGDKDPRRQSWKFFTTEIARNAAIMKKIVAALS